MDLRKLLQDVKDGKITVDSAIKKLEQWKDEKTIICDAHSNYECEHMGKNNECKSKEKCKLQKLI